MKKFFSIILIALVIIILGAVGIYSRTKNSNSIYSVQVEKNTAIAADIELSDTVTITSGGSHVITGTIADGQIKVAAGDDDVTLVLNGVDITNSHGAAVYIEEAGDVTIELAEGSTSRLTQTGIDAAEEEKAALYSTSDLTIYGNEQATLVVQSVVADGISSSDDLDIIEATIVVEASDDGMRGRDSVTIEGSEISIRAEDDGVKSTNEEDVARGWIHIATTALTITASDDGIHAESDVTIESGVITIEDSYEGIEGQNIYLLGGIIDVTAEDDALNVSDGSSAEMGMRGGPGGEQVIDGLLTLGGATVILHAGGDGLDSNGNTVMNSGVVIVNGPTNNGNGAIDVNGTFDMSGGMLVAVGSSGMAETPSDTSSQNSIIVNFDTMQTAGTRVSIIDDLTGATLMSFVPEKQFQSVVFSSPELLEGNSYSVYLGGDVVGDSEYNLSQDAVFSGGTMVTTLTITGVVTRYGSSAGFRGGMRDQVDMQMPLDGTRPTPPDWIQE